MKVRNALLIGTGGFGRNHLNELVRLQGEGVLRLAAVSDLRLTEHAEAIVAERGLRHYADYREMLANERAADFVIISTPIALHAPMCIDALEAGYHVLLEKPPGAAIQDVDRMLEAVRRTGKLCAVNFFTPSSEALAFIERTIGTGEIGQVRGIKGIALLTRTSAYYRRTPWAGKLMSGGNLVMDGAFHNPTAHLLYSMLKLSELLAGAAAPSVVPSLVTSELYHANPIDSDDTSAMRIEMSDGTILQFYVTLCAKQTETQRIRIEGTKGMLEWTYDNQVTVWRQGDIVSQRECREEGKGILERRYRNLIRAIEGTEGLDVSLESARKFTLAANGAFESAIRIKPIASSRVQTSESPGEPGAYIEGIETTIKEAFASGKLFSEMGVPWAEPSEPFALKEYRSFPRRFELGG
ncbi:Gfo/Idh/MocA family protein [Paenibacillus sp. strain BS8-2]